MSLLNNLKIYPNPTNGIFTIEGKNLSAGQTGIQSIEITNINGQTIYSSYDFMSSDKFQLNLSKQPKGVYFVKIQSGYFFSVKKIVIQ